METTTTTTKTARIALTLLLSLHLLSATADARAFWRRRQRSVAAAAASTSEVRFKIKGVERGMLEISGDDRLIARDWDATDALDSRSVWFTFCVGNSPVDEIGHVPVMEFCEAGDTAKRAVLHRPTGDVFVRVPLTGDEVLEVVIYEHQRMYIRPKESHDEILVAEIDGTHGQAVGGGTSVHGHVSVVHPGNLADIENNLDRYARWEIKVQRTPW